MFCAICVLILMRVTNGIFLLSFRITQTDNYGFVVFYSFDFSTQVMNVTTLAIF